MKINVASFYILLFFLPVNWGYHFITKDSYALGILSDYLIPTFRFTDILILLFVISELFVKKFSRIKFSLNVPLLFLVFIVILGIPMVANVPASILGAIFILKFGALFLAVQSISSEIKLKDVQKILIISAFFVSLLAIAQFILQRSVFGYKFFGEVPLGLEIPGIARDYFFGQLRLLPYSLFPHPNILGGYLSLILLWCFPKKKIIAGLFFVVILLTHSYSALISLFLGILLLKAFQFKNKLLITRLTFILVILFILITSLGPLFFRPALDKIAVLSIHRRLDLINYSLTLFKESPLIGVGINNFIPSLAKIISSKENILFLQPVHNIFWLVLTELGVFGLTAFLFLIKNSLHKPKNYLSLLLLINLIQIITISLFDHYFFTIQQGQLLFWIVLGLLYGQKNATISSNAQV